MVMAIEKTNSVVDQIATAAKHRRHHRRAAAIISCENENLDVQSALRSGTARREPTCEYQENEFYSFPITNS